MKVLDVAVRTTESAPKRWVRARAVRVIGMRAAAAWVVGTVVALCVTCAANVVRCPSKQIHGVPVASVEPLAGFEHRLSAAIRCRTVVSGGGRDCDANAFNQLHDHLRAGFPMTHDRLDREVHGGLSLLYRWKGSDPSEAPILLMAHLDVVAVEPGTEQAWSHPPFAGRMADGYVWGRGALDAKCGALGLLEAVELLLSKGFQPRGDIYLALGHDEETGGYEGNRQIAEALRDRCVCFRFVLDEGGSILEGLLKGVEQPVAYVGVAEKGYASVKLSATGESGHSSMPNGTTVIGRMAQAIGRLEAAPFPSRLDGATGLMLDYLGPEMSWPGCITLANRWLTGGLIRWQFAQKPVLGALVRTTLATTVIHGGEAQNALPKHAEAIVNLRLLPGDAPAVALARVRAAVADSEVNCSLIEPLAEASRISSTTSPGFRQLNRSIAEVFPEAIVVPGLSVVATDSRHYAAMASDIYRFLPIRLKPEDLPRIHGVDERIAVKTYGELIGFLARVMVNASMVR